MSRSGLQGRLALVTGASSGLGVDFARELAGFGCDLILVARREALLLDLKAALSAEFGVTVHAVAVDLGSPAGPERLYDATRALGRTVDVLVNNAGFGVHGPFGEIPWARERAMLELDIVALVELTKRFLAGMVAQDFGYVLQVASIGAFQPTPTYASYAAAKSFVLSFGEALHYELRHTRVSVTTVCPGVTATEFLQVAGQTPTRYQRLMMMPSPEVARVAVRALLRRRACVVPGRANALAAWLTRFLPRQVAAAMAHRAMT